MGLEFTVKDLKLLGGVDVYASHKKKFDDMKKWLANSFKDVWSRKAQLAKFSNSQKAFYWVRYMPEKSCKGLQGARIALQKVEMQQ